MEQWLTGNELKSPHFLNMNLTGMNFVGYQTSKNRNHSFQAFALLINAFLPETTKIAIRYEPHLILYAASERLGVSGNILIQYPLTG
ncbi:MAG TPA: hypothetical protein VM101_01880, partial [Flavitalea sp.]|nr:hypothetical protein [Flavitalea sp.]